MESYLGFIPRLFVLDLSEDSHNYWMTNEIISFLINVNTCYCPYINVVIKAKMKLVRLCKFIKAVRHIDVRNYL